MQSVVNAVVHAGVEGFVNPEDSKARNEAYSEMIVVIISFIIALLIISLVGKLLWNGVIVDLFTCVKPARSVLQILGLYVFLSLLFN
jgi:hypothetical protein